MQTLIIEDEFRAADRLERMLVKMEPDVQVLEKLDSVESAVEWLSNNIHPELIFLDIQLADGLSFSIFDKVRVDSFVIFTTAYDEYAIKAFDLNSIDYLLKPINDAKLRKSLDKFRVFRQRAANIDVDVLKQIISGGEKCYKKRFVVNVGHKIKTIDTSEIAWFVFEERSTFLVTNDEKYYPIEFSLDKLEQIVSPEEFFRVNRQFLVRFESIETISVLSRSRIKLRIQPAPKDEVLVSSSKSSSFREWIDK